jgi:outer membrane protein TolC
MKNARNQIGLSVPLLLLLAIPGTAQQPAEVSARLSSNGQTVTPAEQNNTSTERTTLQQLVAEALERNPAILANASRVASLRHRIPQARALPDPTVTAGWNGDPAPFDVVDGFPPSSRNFGVAQTIPFPGKLKLRGEIANQSVEVAQWDVETVRRRVTAEVKAAWFDYFFFHQGLAITQQHKTLLEKLTAMAEARYRVGKGLQQDLLKAQVELSKVHRRLTRLEQQQRTALVRLNTLLNRDPETPLPPPEKLEPSELTYSLESLYQLARENDTGLARDQQLIERQQVAVSLAEKEHLPDFHVGYTYQNRPQLSDTHNITVGIRLPIFYKSKQREGVQEAVEMLSFARRSREARTTEVHFAVKQHYLAARASEELLRLYSEAITPQSSLALESSLSAYQVGRVEFLTVLDNFRTVLDAELDYYRELANYEIALARLEPLTGVELTNKGVSNETRQ